jgi:3-hydroxyacyl-CoA dehydrogenase
VKKKYYVKLVEVVNENWKEEEVVVKNSEIMKEIGKVNV